MRPSVGTILSRLSTEALNKGDIVLAQAVLAATYKLGAPKRLNIKPWRDFPNDVRATVINLFRTECVAHSRQQAEHNYQNAITVLQDS